MVPEKEVNPSSEATAIYYVQTEFRWQISLRSSRDPRHVSPCHHDTQKREENLGTICIKCWWGRWGWKCLLNCKWGDLATNNYCSCIVYREMDKAIIPWKLDKYSIACRKNMCGILPTFSPEKKTKRRQILKKGIRFTRSSLLLYLAITQENLSCTCASSSPWDNFFFLVKGNLVKGNSTFESDGLLSWKNIDTRSLSSIYFGVRQE